MLFHQKFTFAALLLTLFFSLSGCNASETLNTVNGPFMPKDVTPNWLNLYARDICIEGGMLYVACNYDYGLYIFDISDYPAVKIMGHLDDVSYRGNIEVSNGLAYIDSDYYGLHIVDVSDPENPVRLTTFDLVESVMDIEIVQNYIFLACWEDGLIIFDASNPIAVRKIQTIPTEAMAVTVTYDNGLVLVGESPNGVEIFDCTDVAKPQKIGFLETADRVSDIGCNDENYYVLTWNRELRIFSKSNYEYIGSRRWWSGDPSDLIIDGGYAYICGSVPGLIPDGFYPSPGGFIYVIDIADPNNLDFVYEEWLYKPVKAIDLWSDILFAAFHNSGIYSFKPADNGELEHDILIGIQPGARQIKAVGDSVYTSDGSEGIRVIDVLPPQNMRHLGFIDTVQRPKGFDIDSGVIVAAVDDTSIRILDPDLSASTPLIKRIELDGWTNLVACKNGYAYASVYVTGLVVIDIQPPESAHQVAVISNLGTVQDIEFDGDLLLFTTGDGLYIVDINIPEQPVLLKSFENIKYPGGIDIANGHAYVISWIDKLVVIDLDPIEWAHIVEEIELPDWYTFEFHEGDATERTVDCPVVWNPRPVDLEIRGKYAYMAVDLIGLVCLDIDPLENAHIVSALEYGGYISDLAIVDRYVLLGTGGGVRTIRLW